MALLLNVPYAEKEEAKALGARWNPALKKWYVSDKDKYPAFCRWFQDPSADLIVVDHLYIVIGEHTCFKCHRKTPVVSLASDSYLWIDGDHSEYCEGELNFISDVDWLPTQLQEHLNDNYQFFRGYSQTTKSYYYGNHCNNCGVLQGNWFLHSEPDSPFYIDGVDAAQALTIYKIPLTHDLALNASVGWGSEDHLIKQHARFADCDFTID